ncbi:MAG TPA: hypothetical protein VEJ84_11120 [Acidimicrobiales bacterium]|nr:hypothetical protein [Acidimicrobiales bacterium]
MSETFIGCSSVCMVPSGTGESYLAGGSPAAARLDDRSGSHRLDAVSPCSARGTWCAGRRGTIGGVPMFSGYRP